MLSDEAKLMYGKMPGEFSDYWTRRFPRLVSHAYLAMQCVKYENNFSRYYNKDYDYVPYIRACDYKPKDEGIRPRSEVNVRRETDLTPTPSPSSPWCPPGLSLTRELTVVLRSFV